MKSVRICSFTGPYFPVFALNTKTYGESLHIQSKCGKLRARKTPNTDTFHAVIPLVNFKWQELMAGEHSKLFEQKNISVDYPSEDIDETSSEVITINTPLHHEVIQFDWLSCKYSKQGSKFSGSGNKDKESTADGAGTIVVR